MILILMMTATLQWIRQRAKSETRYRTAGGRSEPWIGTGQRPDGATGFAVARAGSVVARDEL